MISEFVVKMMVLIEKQKKTDKITYKKELLYPTKLSAMKNQ